MSTPQARANRQSLFVGLTATLVVLAVYVGGGLDWLELKTLDLRFVYANSITEHSDIVCIDIDDAAIDMVGRWPWPRDVQAALISILAEVGVRSLLVDLTLTEAEVIRTIEPRQADIAYNPLDLTLANAVLAYPDLEISHAMADFGPVYLAMDYPTGKAWRTVLRSDAFEELLGALEAGETGRAMLLAGELPSRQPYMKSGWVWAPLVWARMIDALESDLLLDIDALAARIGAEHRDTIKKTIETCRDVALFRRIHNWLADEPAWWNVSATKVHELHARLDAELVGNDPRFAEALAVALREVLSYAATTSAGIFPRGRVQSAARPVDLIAPVYFLHARAARRCGFVAFDPDPEDGIMRRTRLLVQHHGRVIPQLALAVVFDELGLSPYHADAIPGRLLIGVEGEEGLLSVQLDEEGRVLVPWLPQRDWTRQFGEHVPIGAVYQVFHRRQNIAENNKETVKLLSTLLDQGLLTELRQYRDDLRDVLRLQGELREVRYRGDEESVELKRQGIAAYQEYLAAGEVALRAALRRDHEAAAGIGQPDPETGLVEHRGLLRELELRCAAIDADRAEIDETWHRLRGRVAGKIGLIGYTATALADMTPIPTHPRAPGVVAHANLLNGLLSGQTVRWAPTWLNTLAAGVLGLLATIMSVRWGPRMGAGAAVILIGYLGVAGGLAFYTSRYWIALTPAAFALVGSYVTVLAYRYLFLERERRQIATALSQYTSATLARQMAENAELCKRAEMREVTAIFTDLANFTTISERIGAERTQRVLNVSLGCFSDVMLRYEAMINKFIGDGIFAFWNPVIYPQPDHARRACETAVDLMVALRELVAEQRQSGGDEVFGELKLRVGVATGTAVVGPCGSEQKYDYTCIGDSVNVAARLESANKFYGTRILISGVTLEQAGDGFEVRPLGNVQVKGKTRGVPIFQLLGRSGQVRGVLLQYAEQFATAVEAFQQRDWKQAAAAFARCAEQRPEDLAARRYAEAVQQLMSQPPGDDWNGALELTEK